MNTIVSSSNLSAAVGGSDQLFRRALRVDACVSGAFGVLLLASGGFVAGLLGMPSTFLWAIGGVCLAYAGVLLLVQTRPALSAATGSIFVLANSVWVVASLLLVVLRWLPLTPPGIGFVLLQAIVVGGLAYLQWLGVRRAH